MVNFILLTVISIIIRNDTVGAVIMKLTEFKDPLPIPLY